MEVKITKRSLLLEVNNDMVHNYYYYVQVKIINDENTKYKKFRFVAFFDVFDLAEYHEKDTFSKKDISDFLNHVIWACFTDHIKSFDDCNYFYELCNQSIELFNR